MKKRYLLIAVVVLAILTACGEHNDRGESPVQAGAELSGDGAGIEEPGKEGSAPGAGTPGEGPVIKEPITEGRPPEMGDGGENTALPERVYEKEIIYYSEASGGLHLRKDVEKIKTDYAIYYFERLVSEQERNACITATDGMLSRIDAALPDIEIVVLTQKSYDGISISGSRLYLPPQAWDSRDYYAEVLLAGYGGWGNYGLAYGYADYLCKKPGADGDLRKKPGADREGTGPSGGQRGQGLGFLSAESPEAYDLNLLCFDERFVSQTDVEAARNNACLFVEGYLSSHSEEEFLELLSASGTAEGVAQANEVLEAFYAENGVECSLSGIRYQSGGAAADYAAACEYASFYIYRDWVDFTWEMNPKMSKNFLHEDYVKVRKFFENSVQQMKQYQELFGFDSYNNDLTVFMKNSNVASPVSYYRGFDRGLKHTINLESVGSLIHEYIHSLMNGRFEDEKNQWKVEGFTTYFAYKYNNEYMYDFYNNKWNSNSSIIWIQEYIDTIGRAIDIRTDFREFDDILILAENALDPNASYQSGSSFIAYLADQYGEQAVIDFVCSDSDYNKDWDKSYRDLVQDWRKYIKDNYSNYSTQAEKR